MPIASTRHHQALDDATALVEEIRRLTKLMPEEEDMVMVPAMREAVMEAQKAVMMLAHGDLDDERFYGYTSDALAKIEVLRMHLNLCLNLGYIDAEAFSAFEHRLDAILENVSLPKKPQLSVVK